MRNTPTPQTTRKPIPSNPAEWERECEGCRRVIDKFGAYVIAHGNSWAESMRIYYDERLKDLLAHPPARKRGKRVK